MRVTDRLASVWRLYADGFRNMTWGRPLWILIFLKLFILFAVLRVFFFRPEMSGMTDEQKSGHVGTQLVERAVQDTAPGTAHDGGAAADDLPLP